jgi:hypothetical protein
MNKLNGVITNADSGRSKHLLNFIQALREEAGDELSEEGFVRLLKKTELPTESGFAFVSYCDRFVTLSVPQQDPENWYPAKGWILPAKVKIAKAIGDKYGLSLYEPPDVAYPPFDKPNHHHHMELGNRNETIIIAHPQFLKIRLFPATNFFCSTVPAYPPFPLGPHLLQDLSGLYKV